MDLKRRKKEQAVAAEIASELHRVLGPILPEMLATKNAVIHKVFADAFDFHSVTDEPSAGRILAHVPSFVAQLGTIEKNLHELGPAIVARACSLVCAEAKRVIGEGYPEWPALQPETLARKMMATPLLETGELRASIEWNAEGNIGFVGSNNEKALWHELGTSKIPPRSFLMGAAIRMEPKIHAMAARAVMAVLAGRGLHSSELGELIHLLKHVGHALKEAADTVLDGPDDNNGRHR